MRRFAPIALVVVAACTGSVDGDVLPSEAFDQPHTNAPEDQGDGDTAPTDDALPVTDDAPNEPPPPSGKPLFVAQGHMGRTIVSCDDGHTWVYDQSYDDDVRCFQGIDCDHTEGAGRGLTYGDGMFFATFGWGEPGAVKRSTDGVNWTAVTKDTAYSNLALGNGYLVAGDHYPRRSDDLGTTWQKGVDSTLEVWNSRLIAFADVDGGRFVIVGYHGDDSDRDIVLSSDDAASWWHPTTLPAICGSRSSGVVYGNGALVVGGEGGVMCTSTDAGVTFTEHDIGGGTTSELIFDGEAFVVWGQGVRYRSLDGKTWSATATVPANLNIGPVARSDSGTYAAIRSVWGQYYEGMYFYRSSDGITWEQLSHTAAPGGHPMNWMRFGRVEDSPACTR